MKDREIIVGVTGGIAAYKSAALCSRLVKSGARVHVILTEGAAKFITPLTFQSITKHPVAVDVFDETDPSVIQHIHLADLADVFVVAPATADILAKAAWGLADDMLSTTLLATRSPVIFAPAMNVHMFGHPAVQENIARLRARGCVIVDPGEGPLACGYTGKGRMAEPDEIVEVVEAVLNRRRDFADVRVLVTAGATWEPFDPVRILSNRSTGKMGYAVAEAARDRGATVTLVAGPGELRSPEGVRLIRVETALEMRDAVLANLPMHDVLIKAAAVSDYRPAVVHPSKVKKTEGPLTVELVRNPDILMEVSRHRRPDQVIVGFAAETEDVEKNALEKLRRKNLDYIVANDVSMAGAGFAVDTNIVTIYGRDGTALALPPLSKREVADRLLDVIRDTRGKVGAGS
ncbi:bifunctional phosphopantothenoylcysteine decarboxylase/phosphopantothenate--cysteine ligase CoaBC [Kyrpidia spormannii]|uniref:Coenzyme A biosynthesis bifunctional protein CoaBC n=1 Tax=Kyrpidia spormannii TaxID=2055160 RepID=A0A2K8N6Y6_9BACL|nr:bifunctional phosphopantothenoylcysteine decarboxylase/phosphopantothenate--cysteine ligase CoaBC [Kyrpidia spormannii]ATY85098.1 bifunctional phosphopantothenoylcysteine decarboxylase/phosphopantothenate--cysteine ligase CoaBC [Kyrpidia spormannii]